MPPGHRAVSYLIKKTKQNKTKKKHQDSSKSVIATKQGLLFGDGLVVVAFVPKALVIVWMELPEYN